MSDRWPVPRRAALAVLAIVLAAPVFGWAATATGYTEPLAIAAAATGASSEATHAGPTALADYAVPGLPAPVGTLLSGLLGVVVVFLVATGLGRLASERQA